MELFGISWGLIKTLTGSLPICKVADKVIPSDESQEKSWKIIERRDIMYDMLSYLSTFTVAIVLQDGE